MTYPAGDERVVTFYQESQKLVRFLSAADKRGFLAFFEAMGKGARFETAARNNFGNRFLNLEAVEREFKGYATSQLIPTTP